MNIAQIKTNYISKNVFKSDFKHNSITKSNINTSFSFKGANLKNILNAMDIQSSSKKAQISFHGFAAEKDKFTARLENDLIDTINKTPDDEINSLAICYDNHFGARSAMLLHLAAEINSSKCIEILRNRGADPNAFDENDDTALMQAAQFGHLEAINELLKFENIEVNKANKYGETALMRAVSFDQTKAVKMLLQVKGIDTERTDNTHQTAVQMTRKPEIIKAFEEFSKK